MAILGYIVAMLDDKPAHFVVGVRDLKDRLSSVLRRVKEGESVVVTERRRPIALLVPTCEVGTEVLVRELAQAGRISWQGGKPSGSDDLPRTRGPSVSEAVLEDRR